MKFKNLKVQKIFSVICASLLVIQCFPAFVFAGNTSSGVLNEHKKMTEFNEINIMALSDKVLRVKPKTDMVLSNVPGMKDFIELVEGLCNKSRCAQLKFSEYNDDLPPVSFSSFYQNATKCHDLKLKFGMFLKQAVPINDTSLKGFIAYREENDFNELEFQLSLDKEEQNEDAKKKAIAKLAYDSIQGLFRMIDKLTEDTSSKVEKCHRIASINHLLNIISQFFDLYVKYVKYLDL